MKNLVISIIIIPLISLTFVGCKSVPLSNSQSNQTVAIATTIEPYVYSVTKFACSVALSQVKDTAERLDLATQIYSIANAVELISAGSIPDGDKIGEIIKLYSAKIVDLARYNGIIAELSDIYKKEFVKIKNNPKLAITILNDMARGARDSAAKILGK